MELSEAINIQIVEALKKDENLSKGSIYKKLSEQLKITVEEVKKLLEQKEIPEDKQKVIAEVLGTTVESFTPKKEEPLKEQEKPKDDLAKKLIEQTLGTSPLELKLKALTDAISEQGIDDKNVSYMKNVSKALLEVVPLLTPSSTEKIQEMQKELDTVKAENKSQSTLIETLKKDADKAKTLTEQLQKSITSLQKGKGLFEQKGGDRDTEKSAPNGLAKSWEERDLAEQLKLKTRN